MQTEFAFFPGCVLTQAAKESRMALDAVAPKLGITLKEIPGWSCCGASQVQDVDHVAALVANARNLALAEQMGLPILTSCSTCLLMLRRAKAELDGGQKDRINTFLAKGNMAYKGTSDVTACFGCWRKMPMRSRPRLSNLSPGLMWRHFTAATACGQNRPWGLKVPLTPPALKPLSAPWGRRLCPLPKDWIAAASMPCTRQKNPSCI